MGMKQQTFSDIEYSNRRRKTKREEFLDSMDEMIPWDYWVSIIKPYYPSDKRGRPPKSIETMLRMYLMQNWFNLSDEGIEDAIYDSYAMRSFMHLDFLTEQVPDATTLLHFRHLIEENKIGKRIFDDVKSRLEKAGLIMHGGSIVDATIIAAPSSTKNKEGKRDEIKNNDHLSKVEFRINLRPSSIKVPDTYKGTNWDKEIENRKSSTRCKVEHPFLIVKRQFGYAKVAYRGIAKNMNRFHILFASANLVMCARTGRSKEFCMA